MNKYGIILKNIDLTGISKFEQTQKVIEEKKEFAEAYFIYCHNKTEENKIHLMDELLDEFQSKLGLVEKEGIKAEEVQAYYGTWVKKLDNRPRKKKCIVCIYKADCRLYLSEQWEGQKEAESCKKYKELEE